MKSLFLILLFVIYQGEIPMKDKDTFIKKLDEISEKTSSIKCNFIQLKYLSFSKEPLKSEGVMYFQDEKMRWEQTVPKPYLMVISGDRLKIKENGEIKEHGLDENKYMLGIKEIMVGSMTGNLVKSTQFETEFFEDENFWIVKLTPKIKRIKKMFSTVKMSFDRTSYRMKKILLTEPNGDYTTIEFLQPEFNKKLDDTLFVL